MINSLKGGALWSVGIFEEDINYNINDPVENIVKIFDSKKIRLNRKHIHSFADPFLFVHNGVLFLFAELQEIGSKGYINVWRTADLKKWIDLGPVLKDEFHHSYPFIFSDKGMIYMLPESGEQGETFIYQFEEFPDRLIKKIKILEGNFADSNIIFRDGVYFLFTTNVDTGELELFWSVNLISSIWTRHPCSPLTSNKVFNRNGGGFIEVHNKLYRVAQNSSSYYGQGIILLEVEVFTKEHYKEALINIDFKPVKNFKWQKDGRHHLSLVKYNGKTIIAIDGLQRDYLINKISNFFYKKF